MNKYKAAIIGCGRIGSEFDDDQKRKYISTHAGAYSHNKKINLVAVSDLDRAKLARTQKKWGIPAIYTDYKVLLKNEKVDILSICTPPKTHFEILKEAVSFSPKAIFCEKPIAFDIIQAKKMVSLCEKNNIILQIDHQRRFDLLHQDLRNLILSKRLGEVQQVNFYYTAGIKNTGSHMFDLLRFLFGDVKWIEGIYSKNKSMNLHDPNIDGIIVFKNGVLGTFQSCDVRKYLIFEINCFFERGRIILKNSGFKMDYYLVKDSDYYSGYKELEKSSSCLKTDYKRNFMVNAINHLIECVVKGKDSISSGWDGLRVLELIETSIASARKGGKRIFLNKREN